MLLVIDNYDSFTYNLVHFLGEQGAELVVRRNDKISVDEAVAMAPEGIVISPGPCTPNEAGICLDLVARAGAIISKLFRDERTEVLEVARLRDATGLSDEQLGQLLDGWQMANRVRVREGSVHLI